MTDRVSRTGETKKKRRWLPVPPLQRWRLGCRRRARPGLQSYSTPTARANSCTLMCTMDKRCAPGHRASGYKVLTIANSTVSVGKKRGSIQTAPAAVQLPGQGVASCCSSRPRLELLPAARVSSPGQPMKQLCQPLHGPCAQVPAWPFRFTDCSALVLAFTSSRRFCFCAASQSASCSGTPSICSWNWQIAPSTLQFQSVSVVSVWQRPSDSGTSLSFAPCRKDLQALELVKRVWKRREAAAIVWFKVARLFSLVSASGNTAMLKQLPRKGSVGSACRENWSAVRPLKREVSIVSEGRFVPNVDGSETGRSMLVG